MKHSSRRILALLLALSLCIGMMPMSIFAESETEAINEQSEEKIELSQSETDDSADLEEESEGVDVFETDAKGAPEAAKKADDPVIENENPGEEPVDLEKVELDKIDKAAPADTQVLLQQAGEDEADESATKKGEESIKNAVIKATNYSEISVRLHWRDGSPDTYLGPYPEGSVFPAEDVPEHTYEDHEFDFWTFHAYSALSAKFTPGKSKLDSTGSDGGIYELYAHWKYTGTETVTVTFESEGDVEVPEPQVIPKEGQATPPKHPVREGYTFDYWYLKGTDEGTMFGFGTELKESITLVAKWLPNVTVTYNANGGTPETTVVTVGKGRGAGNPPQVSRPGYKFVEWQYNGEKFDFNTRLQENIELIAAWEEIGNEVTPGGTGNPDTQENTFPVRYYANYPAEFYSEDGGLVSPEPYFDKYYDDKSKTFVIISAEEISEDPFGFELPPGYVLAGWKTDADNYETIYKPGDSYTRPVTVPTTVNAGSSVQNALAGAGTTETEVGTLPQPGSAQFEEPVPEVNFYAQWDEAYTAIWLDKFGNELYRKAVQVEAGDPAPTFNKDADYKGEPTESLVARDLRTGTVYVFDHWEEVEVDYPRTIVFQGIYVNGGYVLYKSNYPETDAMDLQYSDCFKMPAEGETFDYPVLPLAKTGFEAPAGWKFIGWSTEEGEADVEYDPEDETKSTIVLPLPADTTNAGGTSLGTASGSSGMAEEKEKVQFEREKEYREDEIGSEVNPGSGTIIPLPKQNPEITLYAQWEEIPSYRVCYNANFPTILGNPNPEWVDLIEIPDLTMPYEYEIKSYDEVAKEDDKFVEPDGFTFIGWSLKPGDGKDVYEKETYELPARLTNADDDAVVDASAGGDDVTDDSAGYVPEGDGENSSGDEAELSDGQGNENYDVTFYAQWSPVCTVTYHRIYLNSDFAEENNIEDEPRLVERYSIKADENPKDFAAGVFRVKSFVETKLPGIEGYKWDHWTMICKDLPVAIVDNSDDSSDDEEEKENKKEGYKDIEARLEDVVRREAKKAVMEYLPSSQNLMDTAEINITPKPFITDASDNPPSGGSNTAQEKERVIIPDVGENYKLHYQVDIYAWWVPETYTATWVDEYATPNDKPLDEQVFEGEETIDLTVDPVEDYQGKPVPETKLDKETGDTYEFVGWETVDEGEDYIVFMARYAKLHCVEYDTNYPDGVTLEHDTLDDEFNSTEEYKIKTIGETEFDIPEGWKFVGWSLTQEDPKKEYEGGELYHKAEELPKVSYSSNMNEPIVDSKDPAPTNGKVKYDPTKALNTSSVSSSSEASVKPEIILYAMWEPASEEDENELITVIWENYDHKELYSGDYPTVPAAEDYNEESGNDNPTRPEDNDNTYTFNGWVKSDGPNGEVIYTAQYIATPKTPTNPGRPSNPSNPTTNTPAEDVSEIENNETPLAPVTVEDVDDEEVADNESPLAGFEVEPEEEDEIAEEATPLSPFTGDDRNTVVWGIVSILSLLGIVLVARKRKEE